MATADGKVEKPMTDEEWEINKDCHAKQRAHKWQWKNDINSGLPSNTEAICVHCGKEMSLSHKGQV